MKKRKRKSLSVPATLVFAVLTGAGGCGSSTTEDAAVRDGGVIADAGPRDGGVRDGGDDRDAGRDGGPVI